MPPESWTTRIVKKMYYFCCHEEKENLQRRL
ncbi:MAG TPA: TRASH domain-containing protein [Petrimonas mucosa]|nr:TRASH domain-containing protein [Petrimonas mucosa]